MLLIDISGDNKLVFCLGFLFNYFFPEVIISAFFFLFINDKGVWSSLALQEYHKPLKNVHDHSLAEDAPLLTF